MYNVKTLVLGFYDRNNLGDESYKYAFPEILKSKNITFVCMDDISSIDSDVEVVICGGGDIINDYFMKKAQRLLAGFIGRVYALSVGIPYASCVEYLNMFDHVFVRSQSDYLLASKEIGKENVTYYPDAVISLPFIPRRTQQIKIAKGPKKVIKRIGVCLAQPLFHNNSKKAELVSGIIDTFQKLKKRTDFEVHLLSFNTHESSMSENDNIINTEINTLLKQNKMSCTFHNNIKNPFDMLQLIDESLDIIICMRFHSVIFSAMTQTPFVALYSSQKIDNLLLDLNYDKRCCYKLSTDSKYKPTELNSDKLLFCISNILEKPRDTLLFNSTNSLQVQDIIYVQKKLVHLLYKKKRASFDHTIEMCRINISRYLNIEPHEFETLLYRRGPFPLNGKPAIDLARFICFLISKNLNDPSVWGLRDNLLSPDFCLNEAIDYIWKYTLEPKQENEVYYPMLEKLNRNVLFDVDPVHNNDFSQYHRSGWGQVVGGLMNLDASLLMKKSNILLDTYVDRSFHWGLDILKTMDVLPYRRDWIGVIHHTFDTSHSDYNCVELFKNEDFLISLNHCKGLVVLSEYMAKLIRDALGVRRIVPVYVIYHPMETVSNMFTMSKLLQNTDRKIVQVGAWLRNPYAIYELPLPTDGGPLQIKKAVLKGKEMDLYFPPQNLFEVLNDLLISKENKNLAAICRSSCNTNKYSQGLLKYIQRQFNSVKIIDRLDNDGYDDLLSKNIVFLNLIDCSAVNTVLECIVRNTILLVNRHPALEELLGVDYPGFYKDVIEVAAICQDESRLLRIYTYLTMLDKDRYRLDYFIQCIQDVVLKEPKETPEEVNIFKSSQKLINIFKNKYQALSKYLPGKFYN